MTGWLINDFLTGIPGTTTLWHDLLDWFDLEDCTGVGYDHLASAVASRPGTPDFIIRNGQWFPPVRPEVPTIALVQDILEDRRVLVQVCSTAKLVVFNSAYTRHCLPELHQYPYQIIPLSVDFDLFTEKPAHTGDSVLFVGSQHSVKGFSFLCSLLDRFPLTLVLKDGYPSGIPTHTRVYTRVSHQELVPIIHSCRIGICTSVTETQHLAGLEMGACGLPLVTTKVGAYWQRPPGVWGTTASYESFADQITRLLQQTPEPAQVRTYWKTQGITREACRAAWAQAIQRCLQSP